MLIMFYMYSKTDRGGCYEMDKTNISMFEILEPGGSALGQYITIGVLIPENRGT